MSDCMNTDVRDALPDLIHGRLDGVNTATMNAHVESCADCRAEMALLKSIRESAPLVPPMNIERIAAAVGSYGGAPALSHALARHPARRSWSYGLTAALAAVVFVIGAITLNGRGVDRGSAPTAVATNITVGNSDAAPGHAATAIASPAVVTEELRPSVKSAAEAQVASLSFVGGTQDLTDAELETLLSEMDTMEGMPAAEPQSVNTTIENIDGVL